MIMRVLCRIENRIFWQGASLQDTSWLVTFEIAVSCENAYLLVPTKIDAGIILLPYVQDIGSWDQILYEEISILVEPCPHF